MVDGTCTAHTKLRTSRPARPSARQRDAQMRGPQLQGDNQPCAGQGNRCAGSSGGMKRRSRMGFGTGCPLCTTTGGGIARGRRNSLCSAARARASIPWIISPIHTTRRCQGGPWSSARPAPPRSPSLPASPPNPPSSQARPPASSAQQALRPRHQRADARSHEPVPLRGARHLPADPHARGARQQQERHDRSRAQRTPGVALPGRARHRRCRTASPTAFRSRSKSGGAATGRLSCRPRRSRRSCRPRSPTARPTTRSSRS